MKMTSPLISLAFIAALACSCKPADTTAVKPEEKKVVKAEGAVATVNGAAIERADFDKEMNRTRARFEQSGREIAPKLETRLKENLLRTLIDAELIKQEAKSEGVQVTEEEINKKFEEHRKRFGNDEQFESFLKRTKQSKEDVRKDLAKNLLKDRLFDKKMAGKEPSEEDAKKHYEENTTKYKQREQVAARHILFKVAKTAPAAERKAKESAAKKVLKLAKAKNADFDKLAREYSEGPTKSRGGDLGKFSRGRMVKEFEDAAFSAKPGSVIGLVETSFGYHIINVTERVPEKQRSFDEVKESILKSLRVRAKASATREILSNVKKKAKIEVLEPGLSIERKPARPRNKPAVKTLKKGAADLGKAAKDKVAPASQKK